MSQLKDLEIMLNSRIPIVQIETHEERRVLDMFRRLLDKGFYQPVFAWSITQGLYRMDVASEAQKLNSKPQDVLSHISATSLAGVYILMDFHPYLDDPMLIRTIREIAQGHDRLPRTLVLISPELELPHEIRHLSANFELQMPDRTQLKQLLLNEVEEWKYRNRKSVRGDREAIELLLNHLAGLSYGDARRLIRQAIYNDGAITHEDVKAVMDAKYQLLGGDGVLSFETDTASMADVAGLKRLKHWLSQRREVFNADEAPKGLDMPKGLLLLGVQGAGKSLAARAVAGAWGVALLRLDFATLYNKFYGETERNLRKALQTAQAMSPCVLWIDEIEKGLATDEQGGGPSKRILGTLLTWMAERKERVFMVATANDIEGLPPELMRKGRFDEIFFVDLPDAQAREAIFRIHLDSRDQSAESFDLGVMANASDGFSGAEIEQAIVSGLYTAHALNEKLSMQHLLEELKMTRPLSVVMAEKINQLRAWAAERTVHAG